MTAGLDDRRPDHTRPTVAFIVLAVAMTAGMTAQRPETPLAGDRPPRVTPAVLAPTSPRPSREPPAFPDFSMADVVTLAAAEAGATPRPARRGGAGAGAGDAAQGGASGDTATATSGSRPGSQAGSQAGARSGGAGTPSGSGGSGTVTSGSGTRDGSVGSGSGGGGAGGGGAGSTTDAGPGRSSTGQGKARGQQDATPGRGSSATKTDRVTTRVTGRVDHGQDDHGRKSARATARR